MVDPQVKTIRVGQNGPVTIQLLNITGVSGVDLSLSYNPAFLTVIDANTGQLGVQVLEGVCPEADAVFTNEVDIGAGIIDYIVFQINPTPPCPGGLVLTINFECFAIGSTPLEFDFSQISGSGLEIEHDYQEGTITCQP
jgi:hypothetical protein